MIKDLDIRKMYEWPLYAKAVIFFIVSFIVLYLGYVVDISSYQSDITNAIQQEDDLKRQVGAMFTNQLRVTHDIAQLPKMKVLLQEWQKRIITKDQLPELLDEVLKVGANNQLKISNFNPSSEIKDGIYYKTIINMNLSGTYDQIASFISDIANLPNLITVDAFILNNNSYDGSSSHEGLNSSDVLLAQLDIEIYRK